MRIVTHLLPALCGIAILASASFAADTPADSSFVPGLISDYMNGHWDAVESTLQAHAKDIPKLPAKDRADANIIQSAFIECRQPWWKLCKAGNKMAFRPIVWTHPLNADYDPAGNGVQFTSNNGQMHFTISWSPADMDSPAKAEHGFSKGELGELGVWMGMGNADAWSMVPLSSLQNMTDANKMALTRFIDFRSCVTGAYYGSPRARRWGLFLYLLTYLPKYSQEPQQIDREAVGAMFLQELLANPTKYPSIKLPTSLPADGAEDKLAGSVSNWIVKHPWTLAEDKSIRDMLKTFAIANTGSVYSSGVVRLPNNLAVALDPDKDKSFKAKREAWEIAQLQKSPPVQ